MLNKPDLQMVLSEYGDALRTELQTLVKRELSPYKYPRRIWFVAALPKTNSGKMARREIVPPP